MFWVVVAKPSLIRHKQIKQTIFSRKQLNLIDFNHFLRDSLKFNTKMRFICLLLLAFLLCNGCFNEVTAGFGFGLTSDKNEEKKLTDLLQMATSNLSLVPVAREEFKQRYQEYSLQLSGNDFG